MSATETSTAKVISPRKLIEVALPLDSINTACAREKSIRHGHPSTLHLWWARRPLAAARAVIFAQLVNDPAGLWEAKNPGQTPNSQQRSAFTKRRKELFSLIEELVLWENTTNEEVLQRARNEIQRSWKEVCELNRSHPQAGELFNPAKMPGLHDPFAGGGAIPLEAQRLGLEAWASDLNPVAVLINKAMIEIPPKFAGRPPIGPLPAGEKQPKISAATSWSGASGLAEDVRRYGAWMREEAFKRIGHLYPKVKITSEMAEERPDLKPLVGQELTVIVWLWTRTVKSPNPAFSHVDVPLISSYAIGKNAWVEPQINGDSYTFVVRVGTPPASCKSGTKLARGANFKCLMSNNPMESDYIKSEGAAGRLGNKLLAVIAEGPREKIFLSPELIMEESALLVKPVWRPETMLPEDHRNFWSFSYGLVSYGDLFTSRQLVALNTFSDLIREVRAKIYSAAVESELMVGMNDSSLENGGSGSNSYADSLCVFLAFAIDRGANYWSSLNAWSGDFIVQTFARQALPMMWDYAECNPFSNSTGNWSGAIEWIERTIKLLCSNEQPGYALQGDAQNQTISQNKIVSTDPPYYDNIAYADLSDYFYVWLRRSLKDFFPELLSTISVPKAEELVAAPYRQGSKAKAEQFFLKGMTKALKQISTFAYHEIPITIYYAFKQTDTNKEAGTVSTGWETFLEALLNSGFLIVGTWPMRTERDQGLKTGTNSLASCIVLVCRKRPDNAATISRREFQRQLNMVLPAALDEMTRGAGDERSPVAPVDLSQAIIGPGMAIFSKYAAVLEADGSPMSVKIALQLINRFLAEDDFDADTQFCLHWFEQNGWREGLFGEADVLARAKSTSVEGLNSAGVLFSGGGKVRLRRWNEYPTDWDPTTDKRLPVWEALHQLIRALRQQGESASGALLAGLGGKVDAVRQLAYRLYTLCERQGQAEDARAYNELITSWSGIEASAVDAPRKPTTGNLFD